MPACENCNNPKHVFRDQHEYANDESHGYIYHCRECDYWFRSSILPNNHLGWND